MEPLGPSPIFKLDVARRWLSDIGSICGIVAVVIALAPFVAPSLGRLDPAPHTVASPSTVAFSSNTPPGNGCGGCSPEYIGAGSGACGTDCGGGGGGGGCGTDCGGGGGGGGGDCGTPCGGGAPRAAGAVPAAQASLAFIAYEGAALNPRGEATVLARFDTRAGSRKSGSVARENSVGHPCETRNCRSPPVFLARQFA
jgi:hypothetical protein